MITPKDVLDSLIEKAKSKDSAELCNEIMNHKLGELGNIIIDCYNIIKSDESK